MEVLRQKKYIFGRPLIPSTINSSAIHGFQNFERNLFAQEAQPTCPRGAADWLQVAVPLGGTIGLQTASALVVKRIKNVEARLATLAWTAVCKPIALLLGKQ